MSGWRGSVPCMGTSRVRHAALHSSALSGAALDGTAPGGAVSRRVRSVGAVLALGLVGALALAGCGAAGSSGTKAAPSAAGGAGCAPVAGAALVILEDDKKLQTVDNVVPAISKAKATPELVTALDAVSLALDTPKLIGLNKAVGVDRLPAERAAKDFIAASALAGSIPRNSGSGAIIVGAANFPESQVLGQLYAQALGTAGFRAAVRTIGNRELYEPALERGEIHVVPEYVGTLAEFLNKKVNGAAAAPVASSDLDKSVAALTGLGDRSNLRFGKPSAAADQNAFAVTRAFADQHAVRTLSEFAAKCSGTATVLGGPPECPQRPFCQQGLAGTYGLTVGRFSSLDAGGPRVKTALTKGEVTLGLVLTSDAQFAT
ncbi:glycine betaine ABC transporter substrate-binding protein [Pilimelia anulata]|uniref:glycine betaine ABC transporter substrate-binding protein n=1 Tax=Pilimelia anulata TaxID=53371 RepID=UPI001664365A